MCIGFDKIHYGRSEPVLKYAGDSKYNPPYLGKSVLAIKRAIWINHITAHSMCCAPFQQKYQVGIASKSLGDTKKSAKLVKL